MKRQPRLYLSRRQSVVRRCAWMSGTPTAAPARRKLNLAPHRRRPPCCPVSKLRHRASLLLLAFFTENVLIHVFHAFALVGLGRTETTNFSRDVTDLLLVDTGHHDFGRLRRCDRNALRNRKIHIMCKAEL